MSALGDPVARSESGPLKGVRVLEIGGIGPTPFCSMLLADFGADLVRIDRLEAAGVTSDLGLGSNRRSIALNLKSREAVAIVHDLVENSDVLLEGFRPGVAERLGLGPDVCLSLNPRLVYGRMTGYGQDGPLAPRAGHDINYVALAGALHAIGAPEKPVVPLNLVGDFGGGGLLLAFGVAATLFEVRAGGPGRVVDAAMVDGAALLMTMMYTRLAAGRWHDERTSNELDGGAPYYDVYQCGDGRFIAVGALEDAFFNNLMIGLGLDMAKRNRRDPTEWPRLRGLLTAAFLNESRDYWCKLFTDLEACVSPVLSMAEAASHPHALARSAFVSADGGTSHYPAPAPRISGHAPRPRRATTAGAETDQILRSLGRSAEEVAELRSAGVVA